MSETVICRVTGKPFEIRDEDIEFYKKIDVPYPTLCPEERNRRRLIWRNERHLYKRECGLCKNSVVSIYSEGCKFPVYCEKCFWSDSWDPFSYGREFDFGRPFFEQFRELLNTVPRLAITHAKSFNSDYTLNSVQNKNCYLTSGADYNEDCLYGINSQRSKNCVDTYLVYDSEFSYGCLDSGKIKNCVACQECEECSDSWFLYDCIGCKNCAFSSNLRNREYVLKNKQCSKKEYEETLGEIFSDLFKRPNWLFENLSGVNKMAIHRANLIINCQNVKGDYVRNCKNCYEIYDSENLENCSYIYFGLDLKDSYDVNCGSFDSSLMYEVISACDGYNVFFCNASLYCHNLTYCVTCFNSEYLFGCVSAKNHHKYAIFNKQYTQEVYDEMKQKVIEHMKKTGEWGEFFPMSFAPFEYNRSAAQDYMPLKQEVALERGLKWFEWGKNPDAENPKDVPFDIRQVPDSIVNESLVCTVCKCNYRVVSNELAFYRKIGLPVPRMCWPCRLRRIVDARKPHKLFDNRCKKCGNGLKTPYKEERSEIVFCNKCYQDALI